jgi:hypothetical protein
LDIDVQQGNFKILEMLSQVFILSLLEKWIPPTVPKTVEFGIKKEINYRN